MKTRFVVTVLLAAWAFAARADVSDIQARLDAASPGDVVTVAAGTYEGTLTIPDGVTLWGAGAGETILDGAGAPQAISCGREAVIGGLAIRNAQIGIHNQGNYIGVFECDFESLSRAGIWLQSGSAVIANNYFKGADRSGTGIFAVGANPVIANNLFEDLAFAVRVHHQFIPSLIGNVFRNNRVAIDVGGGAKVVLRDNLFQGNEVAVRGFELDPAIDLNADTSGVVLVRGMAVEAYLHMLDASLGPIVAQHPAVIYELPDTVGEFDVTLLFPWATFSIGASAVDTVVADHFAYDWVEPRELNSELLQPENDRPTVMVDNPDITDKGLDRYVLENRFVHPASYFRDDQGRLVFERMTTLSRIEVLPPAGYRVLDCSLPYEPIEDTLRTGVRIRDIGTTTVKVVFEPVR